MQSALNGNLEMLKLLIDNGALPSINTPNNVNIKSLNKTCDNIYSYIL